MDMEMEIIALVAKLLQAKIVWRFK